MRNYDEIMGKTFAYGTAVYGENFTDRKEETKRLTLNLKNGINTILISPRRMGKTSLVRRVLEEMADPQIKTVFIDIYDCRSEYDFYSRYASAILKQTSGKLSQMMETAKDFLSRLTPKISMFPDPSTDYSISLELSPKNYSPEEILCLPEKIAEKMGIQVVVCIDEFQQIGEFSDSITVQKRLRGAWQHQHNVTYCLFGSKRHLMNNLFQNKKMPFYLFGEMMYLGKISTEDWTSYIKGRFALKGKVISDDACAEICRTTDNCSSYVQQLAWNVLAVSGDEVTAEEMQEATDTLLSQCDALFMQQISGLTSYQMNFLRAVHAGHHGEFMGTAIMDEFNLGSKSNVTRVRKTLIEKELIEETKEGIFMADPIFDLWFGRECIL